MNILTYAAGVGISTTTRKVRKSKSFIMRAKEWFKNKIKERAHLQKLLHRIRLEVTGKRERRRPNKSERSNISALRLGLGSRCSTAKLIRWAAETKMRVKILNDRIELRKNDTNRKALRLRFAAQPSLKLLIPKDNETAEGPSQSEIVKFWTPIIGEEKETHPEESDELEKWRRYVQNKCEQSSMCRTVFTSEKLQLHYETMLKRAKAWKAAGPDEIQAYWWKHLKPSAEHLKVLINNAILTGKAPYNWLARGRTTLIYKNGDRKDPANYRPITCLNTCYKLLTAVVSEACREHFDRLQITPREQRGLKKREWSCLQATLLDRVAVGDAKYRGLPVSVCWMDFRKAFESVTHSYLKWLLRGACLPDLIYKTIRGFSIRGS